MEERREQVERKDRSSARKSSRRRRALIGIVSCCLALGSLTRTTEARADDATKRASDLFNQGEARFRVGDYTGAAQAFEEAARLSPHPNVLWNAARSLERAGEAARAANAYHAYLQSSEEAPDRAAAAQSLARLSKSVGRLEIHNEGGGEVLVDGVRVTTSSHFVTPGSHKVVLTSQRGEQAQTILVEAGGTRSVSPAADPAATAPSPVAATPAPAPSPTTSTGLSPVVFFAGAGLTLAAAGFSVGFGIETANERDRFDQAPSRATYEAGRDKQLRTNVAIGVTAGLALATAITGIWLVNWRPAGTSIQVGAGPTSIGFGTSFR